MSGRPYFCEDCCQDDPKKFTPRNKKRCKKCEALKLKKYRASCNSDEEAQAQERARYNNQVLCSPWSKAKMVLEPA